MIKVKNIKLLGILLAILVIFLGIRSLFTQTITNDSIASAIIGISGYMLLAIPYNYLLGIIGLVIVVIAILAYLQKLPMSILKYFYR